MAASLDRRGFFAGSALLPLMTEGLASAATGSEALRLSLNENTFGPSPAVLRALAGENGRLSRYSDPDAAERLTRLIAQREGVGPDQIILGDLLERLGIHLAVQAPVGGRFVHEYREAASTQIPATQFIVRQGIMEVCIDRDLVLQHPDTSPSPRFHGHRSLTITHILSTAKLSSASSTLMRNMSLARSPG